MEPSALTVETLQERTGYSREEREEERKRKPPLNLVCKLKS